MFPTEIMCNILSSWVFEQNLATVNHFVLGSKWSSSDQFTMEVCWWWHKLFFFSATHCLGLLTLFWSCSRIYKHSSWWVHISSLNKVSFQQMEYQETIWILIFLSISCFLLKEGYSNLTAVHIFWPFLFNTKFVSQTNSFNIYWLK